MKVIDELRQQIYIGLSNVTSVNSPNIYELIKTEQGYKSVEKRIIDKVINQNIIVLAAIPQLEVELSE